MTNLGHKGFTLIEVIIVIAVIGIMLATAGYYMGNQGKEAQLKSSARDLISNMNLARTRAIRDTRPWAIQFIFAASGDSYRVLSDSGEYFAPNDPADPVDWFDGDETTFRSVSLPQNISFGSKLTPIDGTAVGDGVTYTNDLIVFNPNGTCSEKGAVYFSMPKDASMANKSMAVSSLKATGRIKYWRGSAGVWSH